MDKIKVLLKPVGEEPRLVSVENELEALQELVDGSIEFVQIATDYGLVCNEEGLIIGLPYNCTWFGCELYGDVFVVGIDGEDFCDVPIPQLGMLINEFR